MNAPESILVIIQRSNGDVFLATPLIEALQDVYPDAAVDLLVNRDTLAIARTLPHIATIHTYDYSWKKLPFYRRFGAEAKLLRTIAGRYDLAINLTTSDRSVLYARLAAKRAISCVEAEKSKSWWKRLVLSDFFIYDTNRHIVEHTAMPLKLLGIMPNRLEVHSHWPKEAEEELKSLPFDTDKPFLIFHPSAQYDYKIYPDHLKDELLKLLDTLNIPIAVTGEKSDTDSRIAKSLPDLPNIVDLIEKHLWRDISRFAMHLGGIEVWIRSTCTSLRLSINRSLQSSGRLCRRYGRLGATLCKEAPTKAHRSSTMATSPSFRPIWSASPAAKRDATTATAEATASTRSIPIPSSWRFNDG